MTNDVNQLRWLVNERSSIQKAMLELYELSADLTTDVSDSRTSAIHMLTGAAFSLWRAVFLTDHEYSVENNNTHLRTYLRIALHDNAIAYPQDKGSKTFASGYYLNNAYFRLLRVKGFLQDHKSLAKDEEVFWALEHKDIFHTEHREKAWEAACRALEAGIRILRGLPPMRPCVSGERAGVSTTGTD